jgi:hypothetical protein
MRFVAGLCALILVTGCSGGVESERSDSSAELVSATTATLGEVGVTLETAGTEPDASEPTAVFSWSEDLTEWVTEAEMTAALQELSTRYYAGSDLGGEAVLARPGGDLVWGVGYWSVGVHPGHGFSLSETSPRLPEGVTYLAASQSYIFSGPNSSQSICITFTTPGTTASIEEEPYYQRMFFEVATMMLQEMGWVD